MSMMQVGMLWKTIALGLVLLVWARPSAADVPEASQVIARLQRSFVEVLRRAEDLGYEGRKDRLAPALREAFDFEYMSRLAVGREWKTLSEEQQARWVTLFGDFTIANYAARLDHYSGQTFELLGQEDGSAGTVVVRTRVVDPAGENVDLSYRLRSTPAGSRIVDIYAKGTVSEVALRRSEFATILKQDGFEALVTDLEAKINDLAAGKVTP